MYVVETRGRVFARKDGHASKRGHSIPAQWARYGTYDTKTDARRVVKMLRDGGHTGEVRMRKVGK